MTSLLARQAENIFWMARQIERVNNLARILDVNATFNRSTQGTQSWDVVLSLYDDDERFAQLYDEPTAESILNFYILDPRHPGSILSNLRLARENARVLRPLISTEMWMQLNVFYNKVRQTKRQEIHEERLSNYCRALKESCQTHTGITHETLYRDEAWYFNLLGESIERADQVTRLVDVKYQTLLPSPQDVGSPVDVSQWNALLRSAAGFHAFRRVHHRGMTPETVAGFLLFNPHFPRSLAGSVDRAKEQLHTLRETYHLQNKHRAADQLNRLADRIANDDIKTVMSGGMHQYMDAIQCDLAALTDTISNEFFAGAFHAPSHAPLMDSTQNQSQSA